MLDIKYKLPHFLIDTFLLLRLSLCFVESAKIGKWSGISAFKLPVIFSWSVKKVSNDVCMYNFFLLPKRLLLSEKNNKCNVRVQVYDGMLRKFFYIKYLYRHVIGNHSRNIQADNCGMKYQLNWQSQGK